MGEISEAVTASEAVVVVVNINSIASLTAASDFKPGLQQQQQQWQQQQQQQQQQQLSRSSTHNNALSVQLGGHLMLDKQRGRRCLLRTERRE